MKKLDLAFMEKLTRQDAESAAQYLGLGPDIDTITRDVVVATYRNALFAIHPDTAEEPTEDAWDKLYALRAAKDMLLEWIVLRPDPDCHICNGTGFRRTIAFGSQPCPRCSKGA